MAKLIILEDKENGKQFRLIAGPLKKETNEMVCEVREKRVNKRINDFVNEVDEYRKQNPHAVLILSKIGFAD